MSNVITHPAFAREPVTNRPRGRGGRYPKAVASLESARSRQSVQRRSDCGQVIADPGLQQLESIAETVSVIARGLPFFHGSIQDGAPKVSLKNVSPASAGQLLFVALSLAVDLALIAQEAGDD